MNTLKKNILIRRSFSIVFRNSNLREYQRECINVCLRELSDGIRRQAISLPVGSGKTVVYSKLKVVFSELIQHIKHKRASRTLILAHRYELLTQAANHIKKTYPHLVFHFNF